MRVAEEKEIPSFLRTGAIRAVAAAGTLDEKRALVRAMIPRFATDRDTTAELLKKLFPHVLTVEQVVTLLETLPAHPRFVDGYHEVLLRLGARCPPDMRMDLLSRIIELFERLSVQKGKAVGEHLEWAPLVIVLADDLIRDGIAVPMLPACFRLLAEARKRNTYNQIELDRLLADKLSLRRAAFWDAVERWRRKHGRWPPHAANAWPYGWLPPPSRGDEDWLEKDARAHDEVHGRLLAFDGLIDALTTRAADHNNQVRLDRIITTLPEFRERLRQRKDPLRHTTFTDDTWKQAWEYRMREFKNQRQHKADHRALQDELLQIRSGTQFNALRHLYQSGFKGSCKEWSSAAVTEKYDAELAAAAAQGFERFWQTQMPPALHDDEIREHTTPYVCSMGLLGLNLEVQRGLQVATLDEAQVRKAIAYAGWQLDGFPVWLDACADRAPDLMREIFGPSLRRDYGSEDGGRLLWKLAGASHSIRTACAPLLIALLQTDDPPHDRALEHTQHALYGMTAYTDAILALCNTRCTANIKAPRRLAIWWRTWFALDASEAVAFLRDEVSATVPRHIADSCVLACMATQASANRYSSEEFMRPLRGKTGDMLALLEVVLLHVRPIEDIDDYHSHRHDAQQLRWHLCGAVARTGALIAIHALDRLADQPWNTEWSKDWLKHAADECASHAEARQWSPNEAKEFLERYVLMPKTNSDLFQITLSALRDIRHHIEHGRSSPRAIYCRDHCSERGFQILFRNELEVRAKDRYSVTREDELADGTRPDLTIWANGIGPVSVEIKIADGWSLAELTAALETQLVGQYMRDPGARHGVLLLAHARKKQSWEDGMERVVGLNDLIHHLQKQAKDLRARRADIEGLEVIGIDFHEPGTSTAPSSRSAHKKRRVRRGVT